MGKLNPNPQLPTTDDVPALKRQITALLSALHSQVNANSGGEIAAAWNADTAAPTTGTHKQGDFIRSTAPTGANPIMGWVCTVSGTPGTWVAVYAQGGATATEAMLGADFPLATTTETTILSLSLAAGSYLVTAIATANGATAQTPDFILDDSTTRFAAVSASLVGAGVNAVVTWGGLLTLSGTTTVRLRVQPQTSSGVTLYRKSQGTLTEGATRIVALKLA